MNEIFRVSEEYNELIKPSKEVQNKKVFIESRLVYVFGFITSFSKKNTSIDSRSHVMYRK